jgi:hypothetical protein
MNQDDYRNRRSAQYGNDQFNDPQGGQSRQQDFESGYGGYGNQQSAYSQGNRQQGGGYDSSRQAGGGYDRGDRGFERNFQPGNSAYEQNANRGSQGRGFGRGDQGYGGQRGYESSRFDPSRGNFDEGYGGSYGSSNGYSGGYAGARGDNRDDFRNSYGTRGGYGSDDSDNWGRRDSVRDWGEQRGASAQHSHDPDYYNWRSEQIRNLDNDYQSWRQERYSKFSDDFNKWRSDRAGQQGKQEGKSSTGASDNSANKQHK